MTALTLTEADSYLSLHYPADDSGLARWLSLSERGKTVCLTRAHEELSRLQFVSEPTVSDANAAQAELALRLSDPQFRSESLSRAELQRQGVTSFRLGGLAESYDPARAPVSDALLCAECASVLTKYLSGGFAIC